MWNVPTPEQLARVPDLFETREIPCEEKLICLHFLFRDCDWYVAEFDGEDTFYGYVVLRDDLARAAWCYFSLKDLQEICWVGGMQVLHDDLWEVRKASKVERIMLGMQRPCT